MKGAGRTYGGTTGFHFTPCSLRKHFLAQSQVIQIGGTSISGAGTNFPQRRYHQVGRRKKNSSGGQSNHPDCRVEQSRKFSFEKVHVALNSQGVVGISLSETLDLSTHLF